MLSRGSTPRNRTSTLVLFPCNVWTTIHCDLPICLYYITVRCWTARLHQLSARNLETNVTDRVAYHSLFRFYIVHVYAFLLLFFCVTSVPSCFRETGYGCRIVDRSCTSSSCPPKFFIVTLSKLNSRCQFIMNFTNFTVSHHYYFTLYTYGTNISYFVLFTLVTTSVTRFHVTVVVKAKSKKTWAWL